MNNISYFFIAAAGGFVVMASVTIQALRTLCVAFPLIAATKASDPNFLAKVASNRAKTVVALPVVFTVIVSALLHTFASGMILYGYWFGMALALLLSRKELSPKSDANAERFQRLYGDCYANSQPPVAPSQPPEPTQTDDDDDDDDDVVYAPRPR